MAGIELQFDNSRILSQLRAIERELKQIDASVGRAQSALNRTGSGAAGLDKIGTSARNAGRQIQDLDGWARKASTSQQQMGQASGRAAGQLGQLRGASQQASGGLTTLISSSTGLVAGLAGIGLGIKGAVTAFVAFDSTLRRVGAISGATEEQMERMRATAQELGASTKFSAGEAAEGLQFLAMAGLDAEESIAALPGVLNLAAAGVMDLGTAADIATNILSGYGFEVDQLARVNDVLAKSFTSSNTNLQQLGTAFTIAGSVAAAAGQEFEVTAGVLSLMANAGFAGQRSGTALRGALARLLKPTAEVTATLARLGVTTTDSAGELRSLDDLMIDLASTGLSAGDAIKIFGQEAGPAMLAAIRQGEGAIEGMVEKMRDAEGTAETVAGALKGSLKGSLADLGAAAEGVGIALVDAFDESLVVVISSFTSVLQTAAGVFQQHQEIVLAVGLAYGGLAIIRTAVIPAISLLSTTVLPAVTAALTTAAGAAAALRAVLAFLTGPAGILALVATGVYLVATRQDEHKQAVDLAKTANEQLNQVLSDSTQTMSTAAQSTIALSREKLNQAKATLAQAEAEEGLLATLDEANEVFGRTDDARSRAVARISELRKEVDALEANLGKATNRMMEQGPALRNASQAYGGLTIGINRAAEGMDRARAQYDEASKAAQQHAEQVEDLKNMLRAGLIDQGEYTAELERATESLRLVEGATELYEASLEKSTGSTKGSTKATKEQLTELQKAAQAYDDMRTGIEDATNASERMLALIRDENLSREQASALIELENAARQAGVEVTAEQREEVLGLVAEMERNQQAVAELTSATEQAAKEQERAWEQLGDSIQSNLSGAFERLITDGLDSFKDFTRTIKDWFRKMIADMAAYAVTNKIVIPIVAGIFGVSGTAMADGGVSQLPGTLGTIGTIGQAAGLAFGDSFSSTAMSVIGSIFGTGGAAGVTMAGNAAVAGNAAALGGSSFGVAGSAAASGWVSTVAAAMPYVAAAVAVLTIVGSLWKKTPPRAFVVGDAATGDIIQKVEKKGGKAEGLIKLLNGVVESTADYLTDIGGQLDAGQGQFDFHINPDRLRLTFVPGSGWEDRLALDVDPEDSAAVADAVAKMMLAAATEADFSEAAEPVGAFFESLGLDMIEALPQGAAEQIIGQFHNIGEAATAAGEQFPWLAQAIRDTAETTDMGAQELAQYTLSLIAIGEALNTTPAELYAQALDQQNQTMLQNLSEQGQQVQDLAASYDGSAASAQALAQGVLGLQQSAVQALAAIDAARQSVDQNIGNTRQTIELSLLDQSQKVDYWIAEAERIQEELANATDPAEIARLTGELTGAVGQAWSNMDADRRQAEKDWALGMLDSAEESAGTALTDAADRVDQIWTDAAGVVEGKLTTAAEELHAGAEAIRAAGEALEAAIPDTIHVSTTISVSPHDQDGGGRALGGFVRAATGWIGRPGAAGGDTIPILVGEGEAVLNRHQQAPVNAALQAMYGYGLDGLFARESRPHSAAMARGGYADGGIIGGGGDGGDPSGMLKERLRLEEQLLRLQGDTAALRERELAALDPSNRALQKQIYALQDQQAQIQHMNAVIREREGLEGQLLRLQGDTAAIRERELQQLDPSNRALQEQIWALEDQAAAAQEAARIEQQRAGLEEQYLRLMGDTEELRRRELENIDPSNRELQKRIWALEDEQKAAAEATRQMEAMLREREGLETRLLQLQGDTAALRERELAALDPANRALQEQIWALQDSAAAAQEATAAAQEAAAAERALADERASLETRLLQLQGNTTELRRRELEQLDPSNRALQQQIWALEDLQNAANDSAGAAQGAARSVRDTTAAFKELEPPDMGDFATRVDFLRAWADEAIAAQSDHAAQSGQAGLSAFFARGGIDELRRRYGWAANDDAPGFASGGVHAGGWRVVGERGPELEFTPPSRIFSAQDSRGMMGAELAAEVRALREELRSTQYQIAKNTGKSAKYMERWDGDGLPPERTTT